MHKHIWLIAAALLAAARPAAAADGGHGQEAHGAAPAAAHHEAGNISYDEAMQRLLEGNQRFVKGGSLHPNATPERRAELTAGQKPFAAVLTCSDSRVAPEVLFDQGLGDIFTIRVAGNIAGESEQGSIEYAAEHLGVPVIMVLGHTKCGAVKAAASGAQVEGRLAAILKAIDPAVKNVKARGAAGEKIAPAAEEENVRLNAMALLKRNAVVRGLAAENKVKVIGALYDMVSGEVRLIDFQKEMEAEARAARKARAAAVRGLLKKFNESYLSEEEKAKFVRGVTELLAE